VRNKGAAYITKGVELQLVRGPDFCGRIYIGKEKNYQQFQNAGACEKVMKERLPKTKNHHTIYRRAQNLSG
jgi:hypothetical protein